MQFHNIYLFCTNIAHLTPVATEIVRVTLLERRFGSVFLTVGFFYPEDVEGRSVSASFLHNGTVSMFEREGFKRSRPLGKNHWVVTKIVRKS